jgi:transketolase
MRRAFVSTLIELAEQDSRIVLLTGDLGYTVLEPYAERFPDRFWNVGVAEQNMVGLATGMADGGFIPFVYSIATFATLRPFEFLRNGPVLHDLPVRVVGVGGGFEYGHAGPTHFAVEDLGMMRLLPGMTVLVPADSEQARSALRATAGHLGPVYFRIGKDERILPGLAGRFELGRAHEIRAGRDLLFIAAGAVAREALVAADLLASRSVSAGVLVVACLQPSPTDDLALHLRKVPLAISVESHVVNGGLGSLVAEVIAECGLDCRLVRCGVRSRLGGPLGGEDFMHRSHGLAGIDLAGAALEAIPAVAE